MAAYDVADVVLSAAVIILFLEIFGTEDTNSDENAKEMCDTVISRRGLAIMRYINQRLTLTLMNESTRYDIQSYGTVIIHLVRRSSHKDINTHTHTHTYTIIQNSYTKMQRIKTDNSNTVR